MSCRRPVNTFDKLAHQPRRWSCPVWGFTVRTPRLHPILYRGDDSDISARQSNYRIHGSGQLSWCLCFIFLPARGTKARLPLAARWYERKGKWRRIRSVLKQNCFNRWHRKQHFVGTGSGVSCDPCFIRKAALLAPGNNGTARYPNRKISKDVEVKNLMKNQAGTHQLQKQNCGGARKGQTQSYGKIVFE